MRALVETGDGFEIARRDLELRGPGDFIGVRQHGDGDAAMRSSLLDVRLLEQARLAAREIVETPSEENVRLVERAVERFSPESASIAMN